MKKTVIFLNTFNREIVILFYLTSLLTIGLVIQPVKELYDGLRIILTTPGVLLSDYMALAGIGPALVNGSLVGIIGFIIAKLSKAPFKGAIIAGIFTMTGFGFFGKQIYSILPIILGVYIYSKLRKENFKTYIAHALFGTALAPIVTQIAFGLEIGLIAGIVIGIVAAFILPPIAIHLIHIHKGYNLYNVGLSAGMVGLLIISVLRFIGFEFDLTLNWGSFNGLLIYVLAPMFISMILIGIIYRKYDKISYFEVLKQPGTLLTDYIDIGGFGNTLMNMGFIGIIGTSYVVFVNGDLNGPTFGAILTMVGFGAFGKHPRNIIPIMLGVMIGCLLTSWQINDPGPILAALFGTTLAPIAGRYGPIIGIIAGYVHLNVVNFVAILHGGVNLYNNGFSAGIVAILIISIIDGFKIKITSLEEQLSEGVK